ncbi:unnamed protein product [Lampetra fluviatilis]
MLAQVKLFPEPSIALHKLGVRAKSQRTSAACAGLQNSGRLFGTAVQLYATLSSAYSALAISAPWGKKTLFGNARDPFSTLDSGQGGRMTPQGSEMLKPSAAESRATGSTTRLIVAAWALIGPNGGLGGPRSTLLPMKRLPYSGSGKTSVLIVALVGASQELAINEERLQPSFVIKPWTV